MAGLKSFRISDCVPHAFLYTLGSGMIDLGTLGSGTRKGHDINSSGQATGEAVTAGGVIHAFLYANRVMRNLANGR